MQAVPYNPALVTKYNIHGPRYTSYPTALALRDGFSTSPVREALLNGSEPLSLYIHLPFCHQLCYYCGCNRVITRHQDKADTYLAALGAEMQLYAPYIRHRGIRHLHLGGGTPTFLNERQLSVLMELLQTHLAFSPAQAGEVSIEIDPRTCSKEKLTHLRQLGFNRVSYGVQDFNQDVQIAINRVQSEQLVGALVEHARDLNFESINLDLVYGLPYQQLSNFAYSLDKVVELSPDRISLFSYAHLPKRFAAQRKLPENKMLQGAQKQALLLLAIERLSQAGYQFIGMDHFAKPTDHLAKAQNSGTMQRNFQGYTTHGNNALLGLGVSSISQVDGVIWQHEKDLVPYYERVDAGQLPISKGFALTPDDRIRAALISQLICHFEVDMYAFAQHWGIDFDRYFAAAFEQLGSYQDDGLITIEGPWLRVTQLGRLWVRVICTAFDAHLNSSANSYSKVV